MFGDKRPIYPELLKSALGEEACDVVFKNLSAFNVFTCKWDECSIFVKNGVIVGVGGAEGDGTDRDGVDVGDDQHLKGCFGKVEIDLHGAKVIPGLIDSHMHVESSLLIPSEYGRLALKHGVTTVIADPHEIANVCGAEGIRYMIRDAKKTALDILYLLPSCVPATPKDLGGAVLDADDIVSLATDPKYSDDFIALGEVMNVPGVLVGDAGVYDKLKFFKIRAGHSPLLSGKGLNAYILQGIDSDHECVTTKEAYEKLSKGMYIEVRSGSESDVRELIPIVNDFTVPRCMFGTDDLHADSIAENGSVENCIRQSIAAGLKPELAYRMATLSAADRFGLYDRGAIAVGRIADFCVIDDSCPEIFRILDTYKRGVCTSSLSTSSSTPSFPSSSPSPSTSSSSSVSERLQSQFLIPDISKADLDGVFEKAKGCGKVSAHVISILEGQIVTKEMVTEIDIDSIPDTKNDILKCVVINRYGTGKIGLGLVHGLKLKSGALAISVAHDAHNVVAVGCSDEEILRAVRLIKEIGGGFSAVRGDESVLLPLSCGGLMSYEPYEDVLKKLSEYNEFVAKMTPLKAATFYLSFLSLTVIPELRITDRGICDAVKGIDIELFE